VTGEKSKGKKGWGLESPRTRWGKTVYEKRQRQALERKRDQLKEKSGKAKNKGKTLRALRR